MIPAHTNIALFVKTRAESSLHAVGNKAAAGAHEGTVGKFTAVFLVPENNVCKTENFVVKEIDSANVRTDVEKEHQRALNAKICNYCRKRGTRKRSPNTTDIKTWQKSGKGAELNFAVVNNLCWWRFDFSVIQNIL